MQPPLPNCHLGTCDDCPGVAQLGTLLRRCFEDIEVDEVEFKHWTSTDRSNLESIVLPMDEFIEAFLTKLKVLKRHDFIAKQQAQFCMKEKKL